MSEVLARWNGLPQEEAVLQILPCCGSKSWAATMASKRPLHDEAALLAASDETWRGLGKTDWLEAFESHRESEKCLRKRLLGGSLPRGRPKSNRKLPHRM